MGPVEAFFLKILNWPDSTVRIKVNQNSAALLSSRQYPPPAQYKSEFSVRSWSVWAKKRVREVIGCVFQKEEKSVWDTSFEVPLQLHLQLRRQSLSPLSHAQLSSLSLPRRWLVRFPPTHSPVCDEWAVRERELAREHETKLRIISTINTQSHFFFTRLKTKKNPFFLEAKLEKPSTS